MQETKSERAQYNTDKKNRALSLYSMCANMKRKFRFGPLQERRWEFAILYIGFRW